MNLALSLSLRHTAPNTVYLPATAWVSQTLAEFLVMFTMSGVHYEMHIIAYRYFVVSEPLLSNHL